jgi:hypothetical protein
MNQERAKYIAGLLGYIANIVWDEGALQFSWSKSDPSEGPRVQLHGFEEIIAISDEDHPVIVRNARWNAHRHLANISVNIDGILFEAVDYVEALETVGLKLPDKPIVDPSEVSDW